MLGEVEVLVVGPRRLAAVRRQATLAELPATVAAALATVHSVLDEKPIARGRDVVLYHDQAFNLDIGVEVAAALPADVSDLDVNAAETPGGRVATVAHWGPYEELTLAHTAIARQCFAAGLRVAGPSWEVFGDEAAGPEGRRTDVFYLLR